IAERSLRITGAGYRRSGRRLLWPHLRLWPPPAALWIICDRPAPDGLLWAGRQRVPNLLCWSIPFVPSSVPRRTERVLLDVASPPTLAFAILGTGSASTSPPSSVLR